MALPIVALDSFYLDPKSGLTLQAQICTNIITQVRNGVALPAAKLPSTRKLAAHLNVSRPTVTLAYQELIALGYVSSRARRSFWIADIPPTEGSLKSPDAKAQAPSDFWLNKLDTSSIQMARQIIKPANWRSYQFPFIYGQMDANLFDLPAWRDCARRAFGKEDFIDMASDVASFTHSPNPHTDVTSARGPCGSG